MYLKFVKLKNWKSYKKAEFEFPIPHDRRNVILIHAVNEIGKTSFFEAIVLGLFGIEGLGLMPSSNEIVEFDTDAKKKRAERYSKFLMEVLHKRARTQGQQTCSVELIFENDEFEKSHAEKVELIRTWHFQSNGKHEPTSDDLQIFVGYGREPLRLPSTESNKEKFYAEFIGRTLIPASFAIFFLFDGEHVQRMASQEMKLQVKNSIEKLLGLSILIELDKLLQDYESNRASKIKLPRKGKVSSLQNDIKDLEAELNKLEITIDETNTRLFDLEIKIDSLVKEIANYGERTLSDLADIVQEEQEYRKKSEDIMDRLMEILADDISLALAGPLLRIATIEQLNAEIRQRKWAASQTQSDNNLRQFLEIFFDRLQGLNIELRNENQYDRTMSAIESAAKESWNSLWSRESSMGSLEKTLHQGFKGDEHELAIKRLKEIENRSKSELNSLMLEHETNIRNMEECRKLRIEIEHYPSDPEKLRQMQQQLTDITDEKAEKSDKLRSAINKRDARKADLDNTKSTLILLLEGKEEAKPSLRRIDLAKKVRLAIEKILKEAFPIQANQIGVEMTKAWKSMAHMPERLDRIEITPQFEINMIAPDGTNLLEVSRSAGGNQIITQALIYAIAQVSKRKFPFIIDTPLARLSQGQREGLLKTFLNSESQVILLSTDVEVDETNLSLIQHRIAAKFQLQKEFDDDGVIVTTVQKVNLGVV